MLFAAPVSAVPVRRHVIQQGEVRFGISQVMAARVDRGPGGRAAAVTGARSPPPPRFAWQVGGHHAVSGYRGCRAAGAAARAGALGWDRS